MVLVGKFSFQGDMGGPKNEKNARKMAFLQLLSFVIQITLKIKTEA